jgi:hypothetical protein
MWTVDSVTVELAADIVGKGKKPCPNATCFRGYDVRRDEQRDQVANGALA